MRKPMVVGTAAVIAIAGAFALRGAREKDELDSLIACKYTQKLIFENAFVRVIDDVIPAGVAEPKHRHPHGVVVALEDADTETHLYPDGKLSRRHTTKGTVTWNEALVHDVKNV